MRLGALTLIGYYIHAVSLKVVHAGKFLDFYVNLPCCVFIPSC